MSATVYFGPDPASAQSKRAVRAVGLEHGDQFDDAVAEYIAKCARGRGMRPSTYTRACYAAMAAWSARHGAAPPAENP